MINLQKTSSFQVLLSYVLLLLGFIYFDWNPFMFFMTYLLEIVVLLLIYLVLRLKDQSENPGKYRKQQPLLNVFVGAIPLIMLQYLFIWLAANAVITTPEPLGIMDVKVELLCGIAVLLFAYITTLLTIKKEDKISLFRDNFLFKCFSLTATTTVALILISSIGITSKWYVLSGTLLVRFLLEWRFNRMTNVKSI